MSEFSSAIARERTSPVAGDPGPARTGGTDEEPPEGTPDTAPVAPSQRRARMFETLGLVGAPLGIAALAGLLYLYYRSLGLTSGEAPQQMTSALSWSGKLWPQMVEHLEIAFYSTLIVILVAIPIGIALTRPALRRISPAILTVANAGQAMPAYGLLVLALIVGGQGQFTVIWALALYALLPVLRNTMVGLDAVDRSILEAGRGMGMTRLQVLSRIEMPLAVPVIIAGVRTAMILNIGMATLAFLIGGGGLGITISSGLKLNQNDVLLVGGSLVALVALTFDWFGALAERYLRPRGL